MDAVQRLVKFVKRIPDPKVGMRLECPIWGREYHELIVTRVSKCKNAIMYQFVTLNGKPHNHTGADIDSESWVWLCTDTYDIIPESIL